MKLKTLWYIKNDLLKYRLLKAGEMSHLMTLAERGFSLFGMLLNN